jgi:Ca-activated chloride channel family protein
MVSLAHPSLLLLLLLLPAVAWLWQRRQRAALLHPCADLLRDLLPGRARRAARVGTALRLAGLAALIVALAGPRWPDLRTRIEPEGVALMMVVDVSGSMAEPDFRWDGQPISRLQAVQRAFRLFVEGGSTDEAAGGSSAAHFDGRPTDLIGLVTFGTHPECDCPLTLSHNALLTILDGQVPRHVPGESETNLSDAIALALERLRSAGPRRKVLVLLSDGEHNVARPESEWSPRQAAHVAAGLGVPIYTIDAGGAPGTEGESTAQRIAGAQTLQELARIAKGRSFAARDTAGLLEACRDIDRLERAPIQSFQYRRYHEAYPWLAIAGLVAFAVALGLEQTTWRRLP